MDDWVLCAYTSANNHEVEKMVHWRISSVASNGFAQTSSRELVSNEMKKGENGHSRVSNPKNWQEKKRHIISKTMLPSFISCDALCF